jgi:hypothetical protein
MAINSYKFNNSLTLTLNFTSIIIPQSLIAFYVNIHLCLNKVFKSVTLTFSLLAIMTSLLDCDINISNFIIGLSINVHVNVATCPNNGFDALVDIGLKLGLGLGRSEMKDLMYHLSNIVGFWVHIMLHDRLLF